MIPTLTLALSLLVLGDAPASELPELTAREVFLDGLEAFESGEKRPFLEAIDTFVAVQLARTDRRTDTVGARKALVLGLCALCDIEGFLRSNRLTREAFTSIVKGPDEARRQLRIAGGMSIESRADSVRHFFSSAALTILFGPFIAERIGKQKEIEDAKRRELEPTKGGYSFHDVAHNLAGIRFACWVTGWRDDSRLRRPPPPFRAFLPSFRAIELPKPLSWSEFRTRYQGENRAAYDALITGIREHLRRSLDAALAPSPPKGRGPRDSSQD